MQISIKVKTEARREELEVLPKEHFRISVTEKAEQDEANERVIELIAEHYKIPTRKVRIIHGRKSSSKILSVPDVTESTEA